jgi:hypothetical protein
MSNTALLSRQSIAVGSLRGHEFPPLTARGAVNGSAANFSQMRSKQTFADGFIAGWQSLVDPEMAMPEIPLHPAPLKISAYFQGLLSGIEAAKKHQASLTMQLTESCA